MCEKVCVKEENGASKQIQQQRTRKKRRDVGSKKNNHCEYCQTLKKTEEDKQTRKMCLRERYGETKRELKDEKTMLHDQENKNQINHSSRLTSVGPFHPDFSKKAFQV